MVNVVWKTGHPDNEINNACDFIRRFPETKSNSDLNSLYKLENILTDIAFEEK